jgi:1-phosphofructokinase
MAAELGGHPVLCGFAGGEAAALLTPLLDGGACELRLVATSAPTGVYVMDRRDGERRLLAASLSAPASRHEVDDLVSATVAAAIDARVLSLCGPYPDETIDVAPFAEIAADARAAGAEVHVDLSPPRLDAALAGQPALVKINDWQAAEFVVGPVDTPARLRAAAQRMIDAGAERVVITRGGEPAFALMGEEALWIVPPDCPVGAREGCGDTMMGALAAARAHGLGWHDALALGAAAGAANFLRRGLGTGRRADVEALVPHVELRPVDVTSVP